MKRTTLILAALVLASICWFSMPPLAAAYPPPVRPVPTASHPIPQHMPGWDWWRIYPWSPYNYGRNPYNPIILPYPYPYPYPPVYPYYPPIGMPTAPSEPVPPPATLELPTVSGPISTPAPGTAILRVRVPETWATLRINGTDLQTSGKVRTLVTPRLQPGQQVQYTLDATWNRAGQPVHRQQQVTLTAGQILTVDFDRP